METGAGMRRAGLFMMAAVVLAAGGCVSPCMEIQRVLCTCKGQTQNERSACEDAAAAQERLAPPDAAGLTQCEALLPGCQALVQDGSGCEALFTTAGRVTCGIAAAP